MDGAGHAEAEAAPFEFAAEECAGAPPETDQIEGVASAGSPDLLPLWLGGTKSRWWWRISGMAVARVGGTVAAGVATSSKGRRWDIGGRLAWLIVELVRFC